MKILNFFNLRTILVLLVSQLAVFLSIKYNIRFNLSLTLFGLAIGFPLAFSIQSAFKRRDKALEYFSLFKGGSTALYNSFVLCEDLTAEKKAEVRKIISASVDQLITQLETRNSVYAPMQKALDAVITFMNANRDEIGNRTIQRLVRYMRDVSIGSAYLISLVNHRTMAGPRFYSIFFIILFPIIQAPIILYHLGDSVSVPIVYLFLALTALLLVTLSNFQKMIEYPFDERGIDNIQIRDFRLDA